MRTSLLVLVALMSYAVPPAFAQLVSHPDAPIRIGHYHLNVTSIEAHKNFWDDTLGGKAIKFGGIDVIEFPDAFIFLHVQKPDRPDPRHRLRSHRLRGAKRAGDGDQAGSRGISGNHQARAEARRAATSGIGHISSLWTLCLFSRT